MAKLSSHIAHIISSDVYKRQPEHQLVSSYRHAQTPIYTYPEDLYDGTMPGADEGVKAVSYTHLLRPLRRSTSSTSTANTSHPPALKPFSVCCRLSWRV